MATSGKPLPDDTKRAIQRLEDAGWSRRAIAKELGVSPTTVNKHVKESVPTSRTAIDK